MLTNARSERVRSLRGLSRRVARERAGRFLVEGPQAVREALREHARRCAAGRPALVREVFADAEAAERYAELLAGASADGVTVTRGRSRRAGRPVGHGPPAGAGRGVRPGRRTARPRSLATVTASRPALVAVLSRVRDPGNAGTVIRAADAAGADAVVLTDESVDVHNPKCVRASVGSVFHLPIAVGTPLAEVGRQACAPAAASSWPPTGAPDAVDLDDLRRRRPGRRRAAAPGRRPGSSATRRGA